MNKKKYSAIIPTYNGSRRIGTTIESLLRQTIPSDDFEIIIVDDASNDNTSQVVAQYQNKYSQYDIRYIKLHQNCGPATARNQGMASALGSIFFFTDDDCEVPAQWVETHARVYENHPEVVGIGGWYEPLQHNLITNPYYLFIHLYYRSIFFNILDIFEGTDKKFGGGLFFPSFNTANLSIKRHVVEKIGGFDERYRSMEDAEFGDRIRKNGYPMYYLPYMVTHHKVFNFKEVLRTARNRAQGETTKTHVNALKNNILYKPYKNVSFFTSWRKFINYKKILVGRTGLKYITFSGKLLAVSLMYFFIRHSRISLFYFRRKLNSNCKSFENLKKNRVWQP